MHAFVRFHREAAFRSGDVLLGLISPLAAIGQVSAYQANQILFQGNRVGDLTTPTVTRHTVSINMYVARMLKFVSARETAAIR